VDDPVEGGGVDQEVVEVWQLLNVPPILAGQDFSDRGAAHAELSGECARRPSGVRGQSPNLSHEVCRQDGLVIRFSATPIPCQASLFPTVRNILDLRPDEQVVGSHARRIVTPVQNAQIIGNGSIGQLPGEPMGHDQCSRSVRTGADAQASITSAILEPKPNPALSIALNERPESLIGRHGRLPGHHNLTRCGVAPRYCSQQSGAISCPNYIVHGETI
jgi:hypothetical protein